METQIADTERAIVQSIGAAGRSTGRRGLVSLKMSLTVTKERPSSDTALENPAGNLCEEAEIARLQALCAGTNINQQTLLATDYLNHFNEIIMLFEMVPSMPMIFEEITVWQPKSYVQHFEESGFSDKGLAIEAYNHVPSDIYCCFIETVYELDAAVLGIIEELGPLLETSPPEQLEEICKSHTIDLMCHIDRLSAIINGTNQTKTDDDSGIEDDTDSVGRALFVADTLFGG